MLLNIIHLFYMRFPHIILFASLVFYLIPWQIIAQQPFLSNKQTDGVD